MGASKKAIDILEEDLVTAKGFINGLVKATHPTMSNGADLDALNAKAFEVFDEALQKFVGNAPSGLRNIKMYEWLGMQVMQATTDAVYGPSNPMRDAENLKAWQSVAFPRGSHSILRRLLTRPQVKDRWLTDSIFL